MTLSIVLFFLGLLILSYGAKWTVDGSSNLALLMGIRPIIVGFTIVSIGTSLPELVVSIVAAINKSKDIALGNIIGSNVANVGIVLGLSTIIRPLKIDKSTLNREIPIMVGVSILLYLLARDGSISSMDGAILFSGIILFVSYCVYDAKKNKRSSENIIHEVESHSKEKHSKIYEIFLTIIGIIGIIAGAKLMVDSAIFLARTLGMSELFIGMTIVAVGTSLPELATSMIAAYHGKDEISVGNVIGSNIFNVCMVIGLVSIISPFDVSKITLNREFLIMLAFSVILYPMAMRKMELTRIHGLIFVTGYACFVWFTF